ncbi:hypothetical protein BKA65DRAFT_164779 [Rhexocercosporidium sp. MPI-PUGE-AT-0058]|nr:hypothetical protein BKA65DRAFT_164779 [Rhexocercosporidium sp. MPI-PUGE-AT-0058]
MPSKLSTFFITAAAGGQGAAVARQLLETGYKVNALVRDVTKPASQTLANLGATLIEGDFDNIAALQTAAKGCYGVYLCVSPTQPVEDELIHARNVIEAAKLAGISKIVCSTVARAEEHEQFALWHDWLAHYPFLVGYWSYKAAIQKLVQEAGFESWTILQPAWIMTNWTMAARSYYWRVEDGEKMITSAFARETVLDLTCPNDVGMFAARAFIEDDGGLKGRIMRVASESLTVGKMAMDMSKVAGKEIKVYWLSDEEIEEARNASPMIAMQLWQRSDGSRVDLDEVKGFGIKLTSFKEYLERNKESLDAALRGIV